MKPLTAIEHAGKILIFENDAPDLLSSHSVLSMWAIMVIDIASGKVLKNRNGLMNGKHLHETGSES